MKYRNKKPNSPTVYHVGAHRDIASDPVSYTHLDVYKRQAFTLLFCLAVGLGVHGAFQYQQVKQEQRLSAEYLSLIHI